MGGPHNTARAAHAVRYTGLALPLLLVAYGYLHAVGVVTSPSYAGLEVLAVISVVWIAVALWQFVQRARSWRMAALRYGLYHVLAGAYFLFVTGVFTPFAVLWIALMMAGYLYFGRYAVLVSASFLMAVVGIDMALWATPNTEVLLQNLTVLVAVLACGLIVMSIGKAQAIDRTELRRSHEQEVLQRDRMLTIVNNLADAVLSTDKNNIIRVYNAASLNLLDTNDSLNGRHIDKALPLEDGSGKPIEPSSLLQNASAVQTHDDLWYVFEDGERTRLEVTISPIRKTFRRSQTAGRDGYVMIMRDVTKAKSLEEERDEFISVVSHELRTPVTVVEGSLSNLEIMLDRPEISEDKIVETVHLARQQAVYLARMINDLSTLSRAERGAGDEPEVIDVRPLVQQLFATYEPEAREKGLTIDLDIDGKLGQVKTSRLYLEELLQNFITNAIKYTHEGGLTVIVRQSDGEVTFAVKDTGIGIGKSDQAKIFEKFYRSEDYRTRETGGAGLGLYVVSKLARKIGADIELSSRLNYGSTFSFALPVHKEDS